MKYASKAPSTTLSNGIKYGKIAYLAETAHNTVNYFIHYSGKTLVSLQQHFTQHRELTDFCQMPLYH